MREQIPAALDGQRVDRVASLMTGRSRSVIASLVSKGKLSCSGELVVAGSQRVKEGDWVEIDTTHDLESKVTKDRLEKISIQSKWD